MNKDVVVSVTQEIDEALDKWGRALLEASGASVPMSLRLEANALIAKAIGGAAEARISVQPIWARALPLQQQSVLFLAGRGPDGTVKAHPCKTVHIAYRACVFNAAKYGRALAWGEKADSFMSLNVFSNDVLWAEAVDAFFDNNGELAHHYLLHFYHGAEILGYKHPDPRFRDRWHKFYLRACDAMHVPPETEAQMDKRLGDWDRKYWGK